MPRKRKFQIKLGCQGEYKANGSSSARMLETLSEFFGYPLIESTQIPTFLKEAIPYAEYDEQMIQNLIQPKRLVSIKEALEITLNPNNGMLIGSTIEHSRVDYLGNDIDPDDTSPF